MAVAVAPCCYHQMGPEGPGGRSGKGQCCVRGSLGGACEKANKMVASNHNISDSGFNGLMQGHIRCPAIDLMLGLLPHNL